MEYTNRMFVNKSDFTKTFTMVGIDHISVSTYIINYDLNFIKDFFQLMYVGIPNRFETVSVL
ncbi:hypothetical protein C470_02739 [Halorubrum distributum JCM 13561]|uniref:Uncharacterized protein n=1 Tax=Halorubrum distributum JCM 13561 TaxID=1227483 RepID=M0P1E6_9EURY|nr:hypothetical protein C470_02739 [Halorubrum litoreum JCM 13561]